MVGEANVLTPGLREQAARGFLHGVAEEARDEPWFIPAHVTRRTCLTVCRLVTPTERERELETVDLRAPLRCSLQEVHTIRTHVGIARRRARRIGLELDADVRIARIVKRDVRDDPTCELLRRGVIRGEQVDRHRESRHARGDRGVLRRGHVDPRASPRRDPIRVEVARAVVNRARVHRRGPTPLLDLCRSEHRLDLGPAARDVPVSERSPSLEQAVRDRRVRVHAITREDRVAMTTEPAGPRDAALVDVGVDPRVIEVREVDHLACPAPLRSLGVLELDGLLTQRAADPQRSSPTRRVDRVGGLTKRDQRATIRRIWRRMCHALLFGLCGVMCCLCAVEARARHTVRDGAIGAPEVAREATLLTDFEPPHRARRADALTVREVEQPDRLARAVLARDAMCVFLERERDEPIAVVLELDLLLERRAAKLDPGQRRSRLASSRDLLRHRRGRRRGDAVAVLSIVRLTLHRAGAVRP